MWPIGHAAVGYLAYSISYQLRSRASPGGRAGSLAVIGAILPDLLDKPLAWGLQLFPSGRALGHSLLFIVPVCVIAYLVARRVGRPALAGGLAIGLFSHVIIDTAPNLGTTEAVHFLLWPLLPVEPYVDLPHTVTGFLHAKLTDPFFLAEFVLLAIALVVWRRDRAEGSRRSR